MIKASNAEKRATVKALTGSRLRIPAWRVGAGYILHSHSSPISCRVFLVA